MSDSLDVAKLIESIGDTPLGNQLLKVLASNMPTIRTNQNLGEGTRGNYNLSNNNIDLSWSLNEGMKSNDKAATSLAHELTHAAQLAIAKQVYANRKFPQDIAAEIKKFDTATTANKKLANPDGDWEYRSLMDEMEAFGVGNTVGSKLKSTSVEPRNHVDASMAQEFAIRSDLFLRGLKKLIDSK
jgi:hypothetical protein